jgi:hypothetical protein
MTLVVLYDLRDPLAWRAAHRHRASWGKLYTDVFWLDGEHMALCFRPAPDEGWRAWELVRLAWILDEDLEGRAA